MRVVNVMDDDLTIEIEIKGDRTNLGLNIDDAFAVRFQNKSSQSIKLLHPLSQRGYYCLTFEVIDQETSGTSTLQRRQLDDEQYLEFFERQIESTEEVLIVEPGESYQLWVRWTDMAIGQLAWSGLPAPNSGNVYSVEANYQVQKTDGEQNDFWEGQIRSEAIDAEIVSSLFSVPQIYLDFGFAEQALTLLKENPSWINHTHSHQRTPLHAAVKNGNLTVIEWLLDNGADIDAIQSHGLSSLHLSSEPKVIKALLKHDPDLDVRGGYSMQTPLTNLARNYSLENSEKQRKKILKCINLLEQNGAEHDVYSAIYLNDFDLVKTIMSQDPDLSDELVSPLRLAALVGRLDICRHLISECNVEIDEFEEGEGRPIILDAISHPDVVQLLIDKGADLKTRITFTGFEPDGGDETKIIGDGATLLHHAAQKGTPKTIQILIDSGVDIFAKPIDPFDGNENDLTAAEVAAFYAMPEHLAVIMGHSKFKSAEASLKQSIVDGCVLSVVSSFSKSPLIHVKLADTCDRLGVLSNLLDAGANANSTDPAGRTVLQRLAMAVRPYQIKDNREIREMADLLRQHGAKIDLYSAIALDDRESFEQLLRESNDSADLVGSDGYTTLHLGVAMNDFESVNLLLNSKCDLNIRSKRKYTQTKGGTALHEAAFYSRYDMAKLLIAHGADVNASSDKQITALHIAAGQSLLNITKLLLDNGAKIDAVDFAGNTPIEWAEDSRSTNAPAIGELFAPYSPP